MNLSRTVKPNENNNVLNWAGFDSRYGKAFFSTPQLPNRICSSSLLYSGDRGGGGNATEAFI
jgi:hypothetical protein